MKPVKRNFFQAKEKLFFNEENQHQITKYFIPNDLDVKNLINLDFEYSVASSRLNTIEITAHYIDVSKCHTLYEPIEYLVDKKIMIPKDGIGKEDQITAVFPIMQDTKWLWKIDFKLKQKYNTILHLIIS